MMQSFEEWFKENGNKYDYVLPATRDSFKAGQQSRQAEVDDSENTRAVLYRENMDLRELSVELQKRIDEALNIIYTEKAKAENSVYYSVDADLIFGIGYDLHEVLKGTNNEQ